ncbi:MAG: class I SAM-dependent methyltransferase [Roseovarius sp.]|nr:class I SAM-dependent methyltransferase [Roseovarius sp.]
MSHTPTPPKSDEAVWRARADEEVGFWRKWIRSGGMRWKEGFERKTDPNAPLAPLIAQLLPDLTLTTGQTLEILDIGSGPLSWVGTSHPDFTVNVTAVDPLADEYNAELDNKGVTGVGRPIKGYFETALWQLGAARFDVVWCANSLDHSIDPVIGLYNIINLCRPGGGVILMFHPDEAEREAYVGLHQWNLNIDNERLMLTRKGRTFDLMSMIAGQQDVKLRKMGGVGKDKPRVVVSFRKDADCNLSELLIA